MGFEKFGEKKESLKNQNVNKEGGITRRGLIFGGLAGGSLLLLKNLKVEELVEKVAKIIEQEEKALEKKQINYTEETKPTEGQIEMEEEEVRSIEHILGYNQEGRIIINQETMEALKQHWRREYIENPKMVNSFIYAFREMGAWKELFLKEFERGGIDRELAKNLIYLAIPESHFKPKDVSPKEATGLYQITPKTGRHYGLNTAYYKDEERNVDERREQLTSAYTCASIMKDNLRAAQGDLRLALAAYNGGYFWKWADAIYRKYRNNKKKIREEITYDKFLEHMEERLNILRDRIKNQQYKEYRVKSGQTLGEIAQGFGVNLSLLIEYNQIDDANDIDRGQIIKIPINEEEKQSKYKRLISDMSENLVYPAKYEAIIELIHEGFVTEEKSRIDFDITEVQLEKDNKKFIVQDGATLYSIAAAHKGVTVEDIVNANDGIDPNSLRIGQEIKIPSGKKLPTLETIAGNKYSVEILEKLNPHILKKDIAIPVGTKIKLPKKEKRA